MELTELRTRLERIEGLLAELRGRATIRDWYSVEEFAAAVGLAPFTVREHARLGRLAATKKGSGRGAHCSWAFPHEELERFRREGLLPAPALARKAAGRRGW